MAARRGPSTEAARILDLAQAAYGDLVGLLVGRPDALLDTARDREWTLRDTIRHAIAVELRYREQVVYSASRDDDEPLAIPDARLPCDRLVPPAELDPSRTAGLRDALELIGIARERTNVALARLADGVLTRPSLWGTARIDVRMRVHQIAAHLVETTVQIEKLLAADDVTEARRIVRRCCATRGLHELWSAKAERAAIDDRYAALAESVRRV